MLLQLAEIQEAISSQSLSELALTVDALSDLVGTDKAQSLIRMKVLPKVSKEELSWFFRSVTSPMQRQVILNSTSHRAYQDLTKAGFVFGEDFSFVVNGNGRKLLMTKDAQQHLEKVTPKEKWFTLEVLMGETPE